MSLATATISEEIIETKIDNKNKSPLTETAEAIAKKRYYIKDENGNAIEDWNGLSWRVVNHVCQNEPQSFKNEMFDIIYNTKFLPNSPCLVNAGRNGSSGCLACFVSRAPEDSWEDMCRNIKTFGDVARRGGGNGVCFSKIRPMHDRVFGSTHAKACGPIEHMRMVSEVMSSITQSGFRGMACMSTLHIWHPDVEAFIVCKQKEKALKSLLKEDIFNHYEQLNGRTHEHLNIVLDKFISNFNISVFASDDFMKAVENDESWDLKFNNKVYKTVSAKRLFKQIAYNAWRNGDPGLLFEDTINNGPYQYSRQTINATNPCVSGDSLVATEDGWRRADSIKVGDNIFSKGNLYPVTSIEVNENYEIFRTEFSDGGYIDTTASHKFKCVIGKKYEYKRLDEIGIGSKILVETVDIDKMHNKYKSNNITLDNIDFESYDAGLLLGAVLGDGCFTERDTNKNMIYVSFGLAEPEWQKKYCDLLHKYNIPHYFENDTSTNRVRSSCMVNILEELGLERNKSPNKKIPDRVFNSNNRELLSGLIDGLFSTDGSMYLKHDNPLLRFTSTSYEMCKQLRLILLAFGIHAKIYRTKYQPHVYDDPKTGPRTINSTNTKYDLVIMNAGIAKFHKQITLSNPLKQSKIETCIEKFHYVGDYQTSSIKSITKLSGLHTVYDIYAKDVDEWNVCGYVQQGCGEQCLPDGSVNPERYGDDGGGSCNLGSIDFSKFVNTKTKKIDWKEFGETVEKCVQFLDNVIDTNKFPTQGFENWAKDNRPVGLGIMGWADALLLLEIAYDSDESIELAEKTIKFMEEKAHAKSVELARQKGTPSACNYKELEYRRNVTLTSIAPTGTISLLAGCSSSIEPIFSPTIYRYDNTGSYVIPHPHSDKEYFRCALDKEMNGKREVNWKDHIRMQAAWQKYCSSAISKTCNLPNSATTEDIEQAYMLAWKSGCKGITVYRDGCKTTQVLNTSQKANALGISNAPQRPKELSAKIYNITADWMEWHIIFGLMDGVPYEIFAVNGKQELPANGIICKQKQRHYSLLDENRQVLIDNITQEEKNIDPSIDLETRRFSLELRHGIPPKFIVDQIDKSNKTLTSFSKAVSRILKKHFLTDEELNTISKPCPECSKKGIKTQMISESGCWKCPIPECGFAKCS